MGKNVQVHKWQQPHKAPVSPFNKSYLTLYPRVDGRGGCSGEWDDDGQYIRIISSTDCVVLPDFFFRFCSALQWIAWNGMKCTLGRNEVHTVHCIVGIGEMQSSAMHTGEGKCNAPLAFVGPTTALSGRNANALGGATLFIAKPNARWAVCIVHCTL